MAEEKHSQQTRIKNKNVRRKTRIRHRNKTLTHARAMYSTYEHDAILYTPGKSRSGERWPVGLMEYIGIQMEWKRMI